MVNNVCGITNLFCPLVSWRRYPFFMEYLSGREPFVLIVQMKGSVNCASNSTLSAIIPSWMSLEFMINCSVMSSVVIVLASCIHLKTGG